MRRVVDCATRPEDRKEERYRSLADSVRIAQSNALRFPVAELGSAQSARIVQVCAGLSRTALRLRGYGRPEAKNQDDFGFDGSPVQGGGHEPPILNCLDGVCREGWVTA